MGNFIAGLIASVIANLISMPIAYSWLRQKMMKRPLVWFWGSHTDRPMYFSFSTIADVDDLQKFRTRRALTHIGDAEATALVRLALTIHLSRNLYLCPTPRFSQRNADYVGIGGPVFNNGTRSLLEDLEKDWHLPFRFVRGESGWLIRGDYESFELQTQIDSPRDVEKDFAVIAKLPHPNSSDLDSYSIVLAGLSMFGTLAAARFTTDVKYINQLKARLNGFSSEERRYFCGIIEVKAGIDQISIAENS